MTNLWSNKAHKKKLEKKKLIYTCELNQIRNSDDLINIFSVLYKLDDFEEYRCFFEKINCDFGNELDNNYNRLEELLKNEFFIKLIEKILNNSHYFNSNFQNLVLVFLLNISKKKKLIDSLFIIIKENLNILIGLWYNENFNFVNMVLFILSQIIKEEESLLLILYELNLYNLFRFLVINNKNINNYEIIYHIYLFMKSLLEWDNIIFNRNNKELFKLLLDLNMEVSSNNQIFYYLLELQIMIIKYKKNNNISIFNYTNIIDNILKNKKLICIKSEKLKLEFLYNIFDFLYLEKLKIHILNFIDQTFHNCLYFNDNDLYYEFINLFQIINNCDVFYNNIILKEIGWTFIDHYYIIDSIEIKCFLISLIEAYGKTYDFKQEYYLDFFSYFNYNKNDKCYIKTFECILKDNLINDNNFNNLINDLNNMEIINYNSSYKLDKNQILSIIYASLNN